MTLVRYGIPIAFLVAGILVLALAPESQRLEGFSLFAGAGFAVLLLNVLHRIGVSGDSDRDAEEDARRYFEQHGRWPDEGS